MPLGRRWPSGSFGAGEVADLVNALRSDGSDRHDLVRRAAALLARHGVGTTAQRLHVSERHLRAVFADLVGMSPKAYARVERVRTALTRIGERDFARLATELGYYDQSHLTNEFRAVMGVPPAAFAAGRRLPPTPCAPYPVDPDVGPPNRIDNDDARPVLSRLSPNPLVPLPVLLYPSDGEQP